MNKQTNRSDAGRLSVIIAYFLIYIVWGSTYYFIGVALKGFPPFLLGGLRFSVAGVLLLAYSGIRGERIFKGSLVKKSAISGIILLFIDMAVIMLAQQYLSSSLVAIIASSTAIWIMAMDFPRWKINFKIPSVVVGIIAGFLGVILLFMEQLHGDESKIHHEYGVVLLIGGCISWALGTLYAKYKSCAEENVNNFAGAAWQMLFAGIMFWICSLAIGEPYVGENITIPTTAWLSLFYLITFGSVLAYTSYIWLLKVRPATEVGTHAYVNPLVAVVFGATLGEEEISSIQLIGLSVILLSIFFVRKSPKHQPQNT